MASLSSRAAEPPQVEDPGVLSRWASAATGIYSGGKLAAGAEGGTRRAEPQKKVRSASGESRISFSFFQQCQSRTRCRARHFVKFFLSALVKVAR